MLTGAELAPAAPRVPKRMRVIWPEAPTIRLFRAFADPAAAAHVIGLARDTLAMAGVFRPDGSRELRPEVRNNRAGWLAHDTTPAFEQLCRAIADAVGMPLAHAEPAQVVHYRVGEFYKPHFDLTDAVRTGGPRLMTALLYLNTVPEGGETEFPKLLYRCPARLGDLLVFDNAKPGGVEQEPRSLHAARPVLAGEKWAMNLWFHARPVAGP